MGRAKNRTKERALRAAAFATTPEELDRVARWAGLKSRRTLERWLAEAKAAEADDDDDAPPSASDAPDPAALRQEGDAELVLGLLRFGVSFTMRSAAMVAGVDLEHPALRDVAQLSQHEEDLVRSVAPSLIPALDVMLEWVKKHGAAVFGVLFLGLVIPRVALLGKVAKKIKQLEAQLAELEKIKAQGSARSSPPPAPPPPAPHVLAPAPAAVP